MNPGRLHRAVVLVLLAGVSVVAAAQMPTVPQIPQPPPMPSPPPMLKGETPAQACKSTVTGTLEMIPLESKVFGNKRLLRVWLPPGYSEPVAAAKRYPVLYLFDGQMLFDRCTSQPFPDEWRVDETMTELIAKKRVEPLIVVGIDNAGPGHREDEYSRYGAVADAPQKLSAFMTTEVLPLIDGRYRTIGDRAHRGVGAHHWPQ
jgi:enterochelin esterase-like enzyme